jgi:hypothetical protein
MTDDDTRHSTWARKANAILMVLRWDRWPPTWPTHADSHPLQGGADAQLPVSDSIEVCAVRPARIRADIIESAPRSPAALETTRIEQKFGRSHSDATPIEAKTQGARVDPIGVRWSVSDPVEHGLEPGIDSGFTGGGPRVASGQADLLPAGVRSTGRALLAGEKEHLNSAGQLGVPSPIGRER